MGTMLMSPQAVGGYIRLLCFQWDHGPIKDDDTLLARITGCDGNAVAEIRTKFRLVSGKIQNERLETVRTTGRNIVKTGRKRCKTMLLGNGSIHAVATPTDKAKSIPFFFTSTF